MKQNIKEEQLVLVRFNVDVNSGEVISTPLDFKSNESKNKKYDTAPSFRTLSTWIRVKFIDSDGTFVGEAERIEKNKWTETIITIFERGQQVRVSINRVGDIEIEGKDFCYSDNVTQCDCPGLCRNK